MAWTKEQKQKQRERAFAAWQARVLGAPENYSPLKVERTRQGIHQRDLAAKVNMSKNGVGCLEREISGGTKGTRARLAYILGRPVEELFPPR